MRVYREAKTPFQDGTIIARLAYNQATAATVTPTSDALTSYRAGKLRLLATSGAGRTPFTPDVPSLAEAINVAVKDKSTVDVWRAPHSACQRTRRRASYGCSARAMLAARSRADSGFLTITSAPTPIPPRGAMPGASATPSSRASRGAT